MTVPCFAYCSWDISLNKISLIHVVSCRKFTQTGTKILEQMNIFLRFCICVYIRTYIKKINISQEERRLSKNLRHENTWGKGGWTKAGLMAKWRQARSFRWLSESKTVYSPIFLFGFAHSGCTLVVWTKKAARRITPRFLFVWADLPPPGKPWYIRSPPLWQPRRLLKKRKLSEDIPALVINVTIPSITFDHWIIPCWEKT